MTPELQYVEANGLRFGYLSEGSGPLVLLLHGFPDTAHTWDAIRPRLAERGYRAVSPFTRGYHPTAVPPRDADVQTLSLDALALINAFTTEKAIVIGHDWGAATGYAVAGLAPERVGKLFTLAIPHPATLKPTLSKLWGVRHFAAYKLPGAAQRFARNHFAQLPEIYRRWSPSWQPEESEFAEVRECFSHPQSLDAAFGYYRALSPVIPEALRKHITVPTVVFSGVDDPLADAADFERGRRIFTGPYEVVQIPGGHFLHREHPAAFAEALLRRL